MRFASCVILCLLVVVGCRSTPRPIPIDESRGTPRNYVSLGQLAAQLALPYRQDRGGLLQLTDPPHSIILVPESDVALVNGHQITLDYPCIARGDEFVVTAVSAARIRSAFEESRGSVVEPPPEPAIRVPGRRELPQAKVLPAAWRPQNPPRDWKYIVIHHAAAERGNAAEIDRMHRQRQFDGLGYDFVIGNGTLSGDGQVEVGFRWLQQREGAHARRNPGDDNWWNRFSIGIVLVGDFTTHRPSARQMSSLVRLTRTLMEEYDIPASRVVPHDHVKPTMCPGSRFPWAEFKAQLTR